MNSMYRSSSHAQFPRQKIYLQSLSQLIDKKAVQQPEIQVTNKLFPQRDFAKKLSITYQRTKSSIQLRSHRFDLHWTSKNTKNLAIQNNNRSPTKPQSQQNSKFDFIKSNSLQFPSSNSPNKELQPKIKYNSTMYPSPEREDLQSLSPRSKLQTQKNFLRKGSNLQKQIVVNLLRNKLIKERELNKKRQYSNQQIMKMIQVFKGVALLESRNSKGIISEPLQKYQGEKSRKQNFKQIKGWQHQTLHDFQQHQEKQ